MTDPAPTSMLDVLRSDHRAIAAGVDDPVAVTHSEEGEAARENVVMDLVRHFVAEEQYLYPTLRDRVADGDQLADDGVAADRALEATLRRLEDDDLTTDMLAAAWSQLRADLAAHVARQEPQFTALSAVCPPAELGRLGDDILGAEQLAPTRPRILAPSSPAANKITSFVEGFLDKARDYYSNRGVGADDPETSH